MTPSTPRPGIVRIWRGRTPRHRADEYEAYNYQVGIEPLLGKALGVQTLREDREHETEFMTISYWESVEAMSRFTGGDPTQIHHLPRDAEFLIELPSASRSCSCSPATASPAVPADDPAPGLALALSRVTPRRGNPPPPGRRRVGRRGRATRA